MEKYQSYSSVATRRLGEKLARKIIIKKASNQQATILGLEGGLGSGKTTFVQGFLSGLGSKKRVVSPTFVIIKRFPVAKNNFRYFFHIDAYRIKKPRELISLGLKKIIASPQNIVLIEWADRVKPLLPKAITKIRFSYGQEENERIIFH